jgi:hypothetical protein
MIKTVVRPQRDLEIGPARGVESLSMTPDEAAVLRANEGKRVRDSGPLAIIALIGAVASCHSPTSPITGQDTVTVIDVVGVDGGIQLGTRVDGHVQFQVTSDLEAPTVFDGFPVPVSYQVYVCLSADGSHFASPCQGVSGTPGTKIVWGVVGPTGPTQTNYVLAFIIKTSDYDFQHPPVTGGTIPAFAIAKDVKPWVINWQ